MQEAYLHSPQFFSEPDRFRPERFLDQDGHFNGRLTGNHPFGVGRRACVGEKLAKNSLFFIICRLMQQTRGHMFELEHGPGSISLDGDPSMRLALVAMPYKLVLRRDPNNN